MLQNNGCLLVGFSTLFILFYFFLGKILAANDLTVKSVALLVGFFFVWKLFNDKIIRRRTLRCDQSEM